MTAKQISANQYQVRIGKTLLKAAKHNSQVGGMVLSPRDLKIIQLE
jgi:hypothetical protein